MRSLRLERLRYLSAYLFRDRFNRNEAFLGSQFKYLKITLHLFRIRNSKLPDRDLKAITCAHVAQRASCVARLGVCARQSPSAEPSVVRQLRLGKFHDVDGQLHVT